MKIERSFDSSNSKVKVLKIKRMDDKDESTVLKYISEIVGHPSKERRAESIVSLTEYLENIKANILQEKQKTVNYKTVDPSIYDDRAFMSLIILTYFGKVYEKEFVEKYEHFTEPIINSAKILINKLKKDATLLVDYEQFISDNNNIVSANKELNELKFYLKSIIAKIEYMISLNQISFLNDGLENSLASAFYKFDNNLKYIEHYPLDKALSFYLHHSAFKNMLGPICTVVAEGNVKSALISLSEFTEAIFNEMSNHQLIGKIILYISIVRIVFEESYIKFSELNKYKKANGEFMEKCQEMSSKSIGELSNILPRSVTDYYPSEMSLKSIFVKNNIKLLTEFEYMFSPIDLIVHIYQACNELKVFFSSNSPIIADKELNVLLLGLLASSPPSNAIAIAKFVSHWRDFALKPETQPYIDNFIAAVNILYPLDGNLDDI